MTNSTTDTTAAAQLAAQDEAIVARAGRYYRNTRYIFVLGLIVFAAYFAYDGWIAWPREAQTHRENPKAGTPHTDTDIRLQKVLACALPPLALGLLSWTVYRSRGAYRLSGAVLSVPGHPDVPLDAIRAIDKSKWDRKGIAYVDYDVAQEPGQLVLDDFIYDRPPTDRIVERIEAHLSRLDAPTSADRSSM